MLYDETGGETKNEKKIIKSNTQTCKNYAVAAPVDSTPSTRSSCKPVCRLPAGHFVEFRLIVDERAAVVLFFYLLAVLRLPRRAIYVPFIQPTALAVATELQSSITHCSATYRRPLSRRRLNTSSRRRHSVLPAYWRRTRRRWRRNAAATAKCRRRCCCWCCCFSCCNCCRCGCQCRADRTSGCMSWAVLTAPTASASASAVQRRPCGSVDADSGCSTRRTAASIVEAAHCCRCRCRCGNVGGGCDGGGRSGSDGRDLLKCG